MSAAICKRNITGDFLPLQLSSTIPAFRLSPVYRGQFGEVLSFLRQTVHTILECPPLSGDNHGWSGFGCALGHAHILMETAVRYQLSLSPQHFVPGPNMFGGTTGRSPSERPHYGSAGKVPLSGTFPGKRDLVWTRGIFDLLNLEWRYFLSINPGQSYLRHCNVLVIRSAFYIIMLGIPERVEWWTIQYCALQIYAARFGFIG